jgi:YD repeat-containing protein
MSRKLIVVGVLCAAITVTVFISYAHSPSSRSQIGESQGLVQNISPADLAYGPDTRNLALQPEAVKLSRSIGGERFRSTTPATVVMQGVLTIGSDRQNVVIRRSQNDGGESVEVVVAGAPAPFSWDETSGPRGASGPLDPNNRALLERLTFDSADEFILAQLRGASYNVVARNVRPDNAPEDYSGALWDVVRVDDPEQDPQKKPLNAWRLYYINTRTGLIDRVAYDSQGNRVEATFSDGSTRHAPHDPGPDRRSRNVKRHDYLPFGEELFTPPAAAPPFRATPAAMA